MAKLRIFSYLQNDVYTLRFENDATAISEEDKQLMNDFGEPEINIGGVFLDGTANEYTLPDAYLKVRSGFPFIQEFDAKSSTFSTNTLTKVEAYKTTITSRFTSAFTTLRTHLSDRQAYVGESVTNV